MTFFKWLPFIYIRNIFLLEKGISRKYRRNLLLPKSASQTRDPEMIRERTLEKDVRADTRVALTRDSGDFSGGSPGTKSPSRRFPSAGPVPGRVGLDKCPDTDGGSDAS